MSDHPAGVGPYPSQQCMNVSAGQNAKFSQVIPSSGSQNVNVLSRTGQPVLLSSEVSGISQVVSTGTTGQLQQAGVARILNIPPGSRVNVVGVSQGPIRSGGVQVPNNNASANGQDESSCRNSLSVVSHSQPSSVNASSHPTLVSSLSSPPRQRIVQSNDNLSLVNSTNATVRNNSFITQSANQLTNVHDPPPRKKIRLIDMPQAPAANEDIQRKRNIILKFKFDYMNRLKREYAELVAELFFLENGGDMLDYTAWRKRGVTPQLLNFFKSRSIDPDDDDDDLINLLTVSASTNNSEHKSNVQQDGVQKSSTQYQSDVCTNQSPASQNVSRTVALQDSTNKDLSNLQLALRHKITSTSNIRANSKQAISAVYDNSIGSQEQIAEKAKQEAYVMQRILELQKEGLWSEKRLPKVHEPPRAKAHHDYLLEEMSWLAADFSQERKWKKAAAKKCARAVQKYFQEKAIQAQKAERGEELRMKKIAGFIAKEIKIFWANVEKIVEYKQQTRLEEKRKQALDQHLSFIVDQTEKYSSLLAESMNKPGDTSNVVGNEIKRCSPVSADSMVVTDDEFEPNLSSSDDERTIAKAEEDVEMQGSVDEIEQLKRESELPLEDFLNELPANYLEIRNKLIENEESNMDEDEEDCDDKDDASSMEDDDDAEFTIKEEESDDEETIQEQEVAEGKVDHKKELEQLQAEGEMSIEDLLAKYGRAPVETKAKSDGSSIKSDEGDEGKSDYENDVSGSENENIEDNELSLKSLLDDHHIGKSGIKIEKDSEAVQKEFNDVAAMAESIQPKGNTLSSTSVVTPVPFLLKHTLREYQHIGLDWLVTMYERKFNGILADEMGLGKTIQTISLLSHLACEKGIWGPHLIIVPTSVMLNWEMEFKKWCPAFKILTYYGTQKERRQKRTGWTKPNAFHICITSYKLVVQDHQSFRRKKWKYLILDEAQNIKNFKSQRWQLLLNFQTQRRLLLTGTPLQNNLMELWSLMHFLMPHVFQSHNEFKEWFSNPVSGMIEGNSEYNESIIKRLHKVLRPFLLRRLKFEVEKQLPKKYEHIVMCRLSKRQRFLYDDFMSRAKTRETLASGNLLSVINVLMQLRKVCNHPNLFEPRPIVSPFQTEGITFFTASLVCYLLDYDPFKHVDLNFLNLSLLQLEVGLSAFASHRIKKYRTPKQLIEEIDSEPDPPPPCPVGKLRIGVCLGIVQPQSPSAISNLLANTPPVSVGTSPYYSNSSLQASTSGSGIKATASNSSNFSVQLVQHSGGLKAIPVTAVASTTNQTQSVMTIAQSSNQTHSVISTKSRTIEGVQRTPASFAQLVQTSTGRHILLTSTPQGMQPLVASQTLLGTTTVMTSSGQRVTVISKNVTGIPSTTGSTLNRIVSPQFAVRPPLTKPSSSSTVEISSTQTNSLPVTTVSTTSSASTVTSSCFTQPLLAALIQQSKTRQTPSSTGTTRNDSSPEQLKEAEVKSIFHLPEFEELKIQRRREKLQMINSFNERRCSACPVYGSDLRQSVLIEQEEISISSNFLCGFIHCLNAQRNRGLSKYYWNCTSYLSKIIHTPESLVVNLEEIFKRFVLYVPAVSAPFPEFHVSHPPPSQLWENRRTKAILQQDLSPKFTVLHPIIRGMSTQFPDPRLIQYDCGKLQMLDRLLRQLKSGQHRVLIFTQMTRMLDVLEAFLNFHGYIYLRLDGTTRVDQRQLLMERFNGDPRIFCFILSTRSGGIGVNLTGADTVIFYDSDWNPTMDAQAQDRCHRIGQTRDVHIYRLVSEMTVEENILKKANQKRMLGDLAIEGGNFTTAYFKSSTIQDLFNIDVAENDASKRMAEVLDRDVDRERRRQDLSSNLPDEKTALGALESALAAAEDETDVQAAKTAKAEAAADLEEFDESIPLEEGDNGNQPANEPELSKAELELQNLVNQLTPVERYAMKFIEETEAEQLAAAEAEIEQQKREWEMGRLQALREEEERLAKMSEPLITYSREDALNQMWVCDGSSEQMPLWSPPTPPQDDNDVYIDHTLGFLYEQSIMSECQLPPIYVRKEYKQPRVDASPNTGRDARRTLKIRQRGDSIYAPRSLFDRPTPALIKLRRDIQLQKYRGIVRSQTPIPGLKQPPTIKPVPEPDFVPEWMIHEDWVLLQSVQGFLELPLNLIILSPAHTPNWDLVADMVNNISRTYRSPKQCRNRYESVIIAREEGKLLQEPSPKKQKKTKSLYKLPQTKSNRPLRTSELYMQDNNISVSQLYVQRFDKIKELSSSYTSPSKPVLVNSGGQTSKPFEILVKLGINFNSPLTPLEVAARQAARIAKEKQQQFAAAKAASAAAGVQVPTQSALPIVSAQPVIVATQPASNNSAVSAISAGAVTTLRTQRTITMQEMVTGGQVRAVASAPTTVVSVANLSPAQIQAAAQRMVSANLVSQTSTPVTAVTAKVGIAMAASGKGLTQAQLQYYKQQALLRQPRVGQQQLTLIPGQLGQKVSVTMAGAVNQQQRPPILKQVAVGGKQVTRQMTGADMASLLKHQQLVAQLQQQKIGATGSAGQVTQVQVPAHAGLTAQILAQVQQPGTSGQTPVKTLVKAVSTIPVTGMTLPVKAALTPTVRAATPQQTRQLQQQQLLQRQLAAQKVQQVAGKQGVQTQLIVQSQKAMTVQQMPKQQAAHHITHVTVAATGTSQVSSNQIISHSGIAKGTQGTPGGQTIHARVFPMTTHGVKQTIQVVAAAPGVRNSAPNVTIDSVGRPQASAITGNMKVQQSAQQQARVSQVNAVFQQHHLLRQPGQSTVRFQSAGGISSPVMAVTLQQQQQPPQSLGVTSNTQPAKTQDNPP